MCYTPAGEADCRQSGRFAPRREKVLSLGALPLYSLRKRCQCIPKARSLGDSTQGPPTASGVRPGWRTRLEDARGVYRVTPHCGRGGKTMPARTGAEYIAGLRERASEVYIG